MSELKTTNDAHNKSFRYTTFHSSPILVAGFATMVALLMIITFGGIGSMMETEARLDRIANNHLVKIELVSIMHSAARERTVGLQKMLLMDDPFARDDEFLKFNKSGAAFAQARARLLHMPLLAREKAILDVQGKLSSEAVPLQNAVVDLIREDRPEAAALRLQQTVIPLQDQVLEQLAALVELQQQEVTAATADTVAQQYKARRLMIILAAAFMIIGVIVAVFAVRVVGRSERALKEANSLLEERVAERTGELISKNEALDAALGEARAATLAKTEFLANMSHEIRTPMNGVLGMLGLLVDSDLSPRQQDFARTAFQSAESLLILLNDILDFSKIEAGQLELEHIDFGVVEVVEDVASLFAEAAHKQRLELVFDLDDDVPAMVNGDPTRLRQVLANLVGNAIKFTHEGEVAIGVSAVTQRADGCSLRFSVRDTGIGIAADKVGHIFESFSQADGTTTRKFGGTGLGLSICKRLASLMGGRIEVHSEQGRGSEFIVTLPFGVAEIAHVKALSEPALQRARALIVDDSDSNRAALEHRLASWRIPFGSVASGAAALEELATALASGQPYRLVLLDMTMPGMSGTELATRIRNDSGFGDCRLLMMTSVLDLDKVRASVGRGEFLDAVLTKPVRHAQLFHAITAALGDDINGTGTGAAQQGPEPGRRERILVAEDNGVNQRVVKGMLGKLGFACDLVGNGVEAVAAVEGGGYGLVFMDCQMPELDGYAATARIRALPEERARVPIVAMTANAMDGDEARCLAAGMNDYLTKPLRMEALAGIMEKWLPEGG